MKIIGITGGTGSGKSTVSGILSELGAKIIDADLIARQIVQNGGKALNELVSCFGNGILDEGGNLDRKKLREIVFEDKKKVAVLNEITHKYIIDRMMDELNRAKEEQISEYVVIDAPIPVEHGFIDVADEIWVVTAAKDIRIERIMERSRLTREEAEKIIDSQITEDEYLKLADEVLVNDGNLGELKEKVRTLLAK